MQYRVLDWDTKFFGFKIAEINQSQQGSRELEKILSTLKKQKIRLVYWVSDLVCEDVILKTYGGKLVDEKITFVIDFSDKNSGDFTVSKNVEPYVDSMSLAALENLAIQSGEYSRFAVDPNIPRKQFIDMYKTWIWKSLRKELADEVFVLQDTDRIAGMVTLGEKNKRGDIGLIAVDSASRNKNFGQTLVRAAQNWFMVNNYQFGQVVTQGQNTAACNLYKKCGYTVEKTEYSYHFWL